MALNEARYMAFPVTQFVPSDGSPPLNELVEEEHKAGSAEFRRWKPEGQLESVTRWDKYTRHVRPECR
jgi:hypothetical protein